MANPTGPTGRATDATSRSERRAGARARVLLPLAAAMLATVAIVSPAGDFPLNDDWVYAEIVGSIVEDGSFYEHPYRGSLVVTQSYWGALFAAVFGSSHAVLRCSTLVLAFFAVVATARGALAHGLDRTLALLCGAVVLANPVFLNLAYTFMSDVPFTAALCIAGVFYLRALSERSAAAAFSGSVFVAAAAATKQIGVVVVAAFVATEVVSWARGRERPEPRLLAALATPLVVGAGLYVAAFGLPTTANVYFWPEQARKPSLWEAVPTLVYHAGAALTYLGLFAAPFAVGKLAGIARGGAHRTRLSWIAAAWIAVALQATALSIHDGVVGIRGMPLLGNVLYDLGTGPMTLRDVYVLGHPRPGGIGAWWWLVQALSLASAALLAVDVLPGVARYALGRSTGGAPDASRRDAQAVFLALWVAAFAFFPYHLLTDSVYDRYLLPALFPVTILAARSLGKAGRGATSAAWMATAVLFAFSLAAVHDYLAWNRARWEAADWLRDERGVDAKEIDGGFEYNGTYLSAEYRRRHDVTSFFSQGPGRFWLLDETKYAIFANPVAGCRRLADFRYASWLGLETRRVYALRCDGR